MNIMDIVPNLRVRMTYRDWDQKIQSCLLTIVEVNHLPVFPKLPANPIMTLETKECGRVWIYPNSTETFEIVESV